MLNRRRFLKIAGATGLTLGATATAKIAQATISDPHAPARPGQEGPTADEMDAMHEIGVKYFLENVGKNPDFWGVTLPFTMDGDVKVFEITCTEGPWEVGADFSTGTQTAVTVDAMMYNGVVPGPIIRVTQGDKVRINVKNEMKQSTGVHFHGIHTPNSMDGVPFVTQPPIKPGQTFTYEFVAKNSGTHMYHSHHNAAEQVSRGLMGAFIIDPLDTTNEPRVDADYVYVLNDAGIGMTINGKGFPSTQPILAKKGDRIRIRYMNEGFQIHPMHLHGMYQLIIAKDGANLPAPYLADTIIVGPGERYDVIVDCQEPGAWAFHCHILTHAESAHGMFGMVTALVIQ
jgi:FtsP/CotA-like multicopper oxidase with cupredoxin domain